MSHYMTPVTAPAGTLRSLTLIVAPALAALLLTLGAAPALAVSIPYTVTFDQTAPSVDTFIGSFTADSADIAAGSGMLTGFSITIGPETFDLASDTVGTNMFLSNGTDVTKLDLFITDTVSTVNLEVFTSLFWTTTEREGTYTAPQRVAMSVPEPPTFGVMGVRLATLALFGFARKKVA